MKYQRKGTVEAFQYDGGLMNSHGEYYVPEWAVKAYEEDKLYYHESKLLCRAKERSVVVEIGNYIVFDGNEIYPCREHIFEVVYEPMKEER